MSSTTRRARVGTRRRSPGRSRSWRGPKRRRTRPSARAPVNLASCWWRATPNRRPTGTGAPTGCACRSTTAISAHAWPRSNGWPRACRSRRSTSSTCLWRGDRWVALAPIEARMLEVLLARCGSVVSRRELGIGRVARRRARHPGGRLPAAPSARPRRTARPADPQRASSRVDAGGRRPQPLITGGAVSGAVRRACPGGRGVRRRAPRPRPATTRLPARARARASRSRPRGTPRAGRASAGMPTTITSPGSKPSRAPTMLA